TVPGLGTSFGRGGATTAQQDLINSDAILIMGSSMAENHPVGFQWVMEARKRGATVIHVDPRFTRTSAMADIWMPLRAGSDIVLLGALINFVLQNERDFREYVVNYTNASVILRDDFKDTEDLDGLFSGWDAEKKQYKTDTWAYKDAPMENGGKQSPHGGHAKDRGGEKTKEDVYRQDVTLRDPRCVYQILKRHFSRYTPEMIERSCGVPGNCFLNWPRRSVARPGPIKPERFATRSAGRSIPTACRSYARPRFCNCCLEISAARAAAYWHCAAMPPFKAQRTFPRYTIFFPATCRCRSSPRTRIRSAIT